jgi:hypothetical protein
MMAIFTPVISSPYYFGCASRSPVWVYALSPVGSSLTRSLHRRKARVLVQGLGAHVEMLLRHHQDVRSRKVFGGMSSLRWVRILRLKDGWHCDILQADRNHRQETTSRCSGSLEMPETHLEIQSKQTQVFAAAREAQVDCRGQNT